MAQIAFTDNLQRHVACPPRSVDGATVRDVLNAVFAEYPALRSYIVDDQRRLRKHVNIFINDALITDRLTLSDAVAPDDRVFVFQALSGG
ncbi:MAG: MoaD/ThiS family protein [Pseudomonadota bacterium]